MTHEQFRSETRPRRDGIMAFTGILIGALLGVLCWVIIVLMVWEGMEAMR